MGFEAPVVERRRYGRIVSARDSASRERLSASKLGVVVGPCDMLRYFYQCLWQRLLPQCLSAPMLTRIGLKLKGVNCATGDATGKASQVLSVCYTLTTRLEYAGADPPRPKLPGVPSLVASKNGSTRSRPSIHPWTPESRRHAQRDEMVMPGKLQRRPAAPPHLG
jgi:hypothetical protein